MMFKTKKMIVPLDINKPRTRKQGFLLPVFIEDQVVFKDTTKHKSYDHGRIVMTGVDLTAKELYSKAQKEGMLNVSKRAALQLFEDYLTQIAALKIGNVVKVGSEGNGIVLEKIKIKIQKAKRLP